MGLRVTRTAPLTEKHLRGLVPVIELLLTWTASLSIFGVLFSALSRVYLT